MMIRLGRLVGFILPITAIACGGSSSPAAPTPNAASLSIVGLTATAAPLTTTPQPGLVYRLRYGVRESGGRVGATLTHQHFVLSDGQTADGDFSATLKTPYVGAAGTITVESTLSIYPSTIAASHVTFTVTFSDDAGHSGTATADSDVVRSDPLG